jgi:hypothetical protein
VEEARSGSMVEMATTQSEGEGVTARSRLGEFAIEGVRS